MPAAPPPKPKASQFWQTLEKLKRPHKLGIFFGTILLFGVLFWFLFLEPTLDSINTAKTDIEKLTEMVKKHTRTAAEIPKVLARLHEVRLQLAHLAQFLPQKKEVPELLRRISDEGSQAGLNVTLFQPRLQETIKDFYAEISFEMKVEGPYLNVANFFYRIGRMERIVNIEDIKMATPVMVEGEMVLTTSCQGRTFRYLSEEEIKAQEEARKAAEKKAAPRPQPKDDLLKK